MAGGRRTVAELRAALRARGAPAGGRKAELEARLAGLEARLGALAARAGGAGAAGGRAAAPAAAAGAPAAAGVAELVAGLGAQGGPLRVDLGALASTAPAARVAPAPPARAPARGTASPPSVSSASDQSAGPAGSSDFASDLDDGAEGGDGLASALRRRFAGSGEPGGDEGESGGGGGGGGAEEEKPVEDWLTWKAVAGLPEAMDAEAAVVADRAREEELRKAERRRRDAGPGWHHIPERELTPDQRRELKLLKLRGAMDPKQHYRAADSSKLPTRFHVGTVIEGPAEYYSGRLSRRERRPNFTQQVLGDDAVRAYAKRKFRSINEAAAAKAGPRYRGGLERNKKKRKSNHKGWKG